jgi:hypothetical protein
MTQGPIHFSRAVGQGRKITLAGGLSGPVILICYRVNHGSK